MEKAQALELASWLSWIFFSSTSIFYFLDFRLTLRSILAEKVSILVRLFRVKLRINLFFLTFIFLFTKMQVGV